ncbi:MAG: hypothetical protein Q9227_009533 [Pyrenula ochraceoflavens]
MRGYVLASLAVSASLSAAQGTPAAVTTNNPVGATYEATLLDKSSTDIRGTVVGTSNSNGTGVMFNVNLYGFPDASLGPFIYHIHSTPLDPSGNCTTALAHLDPYQRGETPPCDATQPQTCQVGDLSGKHGKISGGAFTASYLDLYTSTQEGLGSFFGNRSLVVHSANATRLNCANFTMVSAGSGSGSPSPSGSPVPSSSASASASAGGGGSPTSVSPPITSFTGAATKEKAISAGLAVVGGLAAFLI